MNANPGPPPPEDFARNIDAAKAGDPDAQNAIGRCYSHGSGVERSELAAFEWFSKAADRGHARAQRNLGACFLHGRGCPEDGVRARALFEKSASQNDPLGQVALAHCFREGIGGITNTLQANRLMLAAAEAGVVEAQRFMGSTLRRDSSEPENFERAVHWLKLAAGQGDSFSMCALGVIYQEEKYSGRDPAEAIKWFEMSAKLNHPHACGIMGEKCLLGKGVTKDIPRAIAYYEIAAAAEIGHAHMRLGWIYRHGHGVHKNRRKAHEHFVKATQLGVTGLELDELATRDISALTSVLVVVSIIVFGIGVVALEAYLRQLLPKTSKPFSTFVGNTIMILTIINIRAAFGIWGLRSSSRAFIFGIHDIWAAWVSLVPTLFVFVRTGRVWLHPTGDNELPIRLAILSCLTLLAQMTGIILGRMIFLRRNVTIQRSSPSYVFTMGLVAALAIYTMASICGAVNDLF